MATLPLAANSRSPGKAIIAYSAIVIAIEIALVAAMERLGPHSTAGNLLMVAIMWTPGIVAMALQYATERTLRGFGWKLGPLRYFGIGYALPMAYGGLTLLVAQALGAGTIDFERWATGAAKWGFPEHALFGLLIQGVLFMLPGMIMGLGEEIGWRGYLVPKLQRLFGFWGVVNASCVVWLAFHLPGMFGGGYHGQGTPMWYSLICFAALIYPGTIFLTWLRIRSGSLWPCAFFHAAHNVSVQVLWFSAWKPGALSSWLTGEFGALLPLVSGALIGLLMWKVGLFRGQGVYLHDQNPKAV
jgi:membrane protease YdiL (CAAX protease family)